jgi:branched-chain amino acid transport system ATP-binding protein
VRDASAPALLSIENVRKRFHGLSVLEGLSLTLASGESLGLAGRTGCGKTTLLHIVSGFLRPEEGRVWFRGRDLTGWPPYRIVRTGIARTFQHVTFFAPLTVAETLRAAALHRRLRGRAREDAVTFALETVDLGTLRAREVGTLSPGELRRLDVARALATGPHLLLVDEPSASLDPGDLPEVLSALRRVRAGGMPMVIAAHSRTLFEVLCDRVAVIQDGRVNRMGSPGDVCDA